MLLTLPFEKLNIITDLCYHPIVSSCLNYCCISLLRLEKLITIQHTFLARDDYRMKVEMQEKELLELQSKLEELQKMADEARHLKDEVDILKETADKAVKYEATIASYKKKLEEYGDLKRQVKILEDKNTDYVQQNMELEEVYTLYFFVIIMVLS